MSNCNCQVQYGSQFHNPCSVSETNTAQCESTPSVVENFVKHFFGTIEKTEEDGEVTWILPCRLDQGLPENPRQENEGLACYFLRLFEEGIRGLQGPQGPPGPAGKDGVPGYTITLSSFTQPSLDNPIFTVKLAPNPFLVTGMTLYVEKCGWARLDVIGSEYTALLTLLEPAPDAMPGIVAPGKKVSAAGPRGQKGEKGDRGDTGPQGPQGDTFTALSNIVLAQSTQNYDLTTNWTAVDFTTIDPAVSVPVEGTYLVFAQALVSKIGSDQTPNDWAELRIYNVTGGSGVSAPYAKAFYIRQGSYVNLSITGIATLGQEHTIALYGRASHNNLYTVVREHASIGYVLLAPAS